MELHQILIFAGIACGVIGLIIKFMPKESSKEEKDDDPLKLR